ncbi:ATP-binding cassette domain-containing protein [Legionella sainthelensi]|uniref:ATP-binding cassette domain-containing protein n=1 Tax=Legionella sainthelensi TaxID=28087 RepID=UPI000E1FE4FB|nr:ATP-binding cassette domain-containing protein [Legionella sainthelensi]
MNDSELEDIAPGLLKIQQVLGHKDTKTHSISDNKKLLIDALLHLAELMEVSLKIPSGDLGDDLDDLMEKISTHSGIRIHKMTLGDKWWNHDLGIFLGFMDNSPCVLVPKKNGGYQCSTPTEVITLSPNQLNKIDAYGFSFIKPLPKTATKLLDILKFSFSTLKNELQSILYLQLGLSLILMSLPILMSYFFNNFSQFIESGQITLLAILLIINTLIFFLLSINQTVLMLNLRFKIQRRLEPAIWDRLLKLTPTFFRQLNAGDIAYRAGVVSTIQEMLTQSTILSLFSVIVAFLSFILMCYYNLMLAVLALVSVFVISSAILFISHRLLIHQRKVYEYLTKLSGFVFQVISGIMKFKASASEYRAFNIWSDYFSNLLIARYKADKIRISIHIIHGSLLLLMTLILFCIYFYFNKQMQIGTFIAFNAAFSQFFSALLTLTTFISSILIIVPLFEQSLIIFEAKVEPLQLGGSHIKIEGKIQIKNLSFRYEDNQPLIYKNINLLINPGEVIGITGNSGCGKSTLFRILLGLEKPLDGQIFYDDINMDMINLANLRQQIGVVTQKSVLTPGTILENIIGNDKHLTRNDAWNIVYHLGLEQMISALPMEMDTFINEGMQSLSGGEQQRIVLARALIKKPKILFLDEATSALDNQNQTKIQDYLAKLNITQIVIAHRLSTLKSASRILVIDEGRIIQEGNFEQLIQTEGYFAELAKFQFPDFENKTKKT